MHKPGELFHHGASQCLFGPRKITEVFIPLLYGGDFDIHRGLQWAARGIMADRQREQKVGRGGLACLVVC